VRSHEERGLTRRHACASDFRPRAFTGGEALLEDVDDLVLERALPLELRGTALRRRERDELRANGAADLPRLVGDGEVGGACGVGRSTRAQAALVRGLDRRVEAEGGDPGGGVQLCFVLDRRVGRRIRPLRGGGDRRVHHGGVRARDVEAGMKAERGVGEAAQIPRLRRIELARVERRRRLRGRDRMRRDVDARGKDT